MLQEAPCEADPLITATEPRDLEVGSHVEVSVFEPRNPKLAQGALGHICGMGDNDGDFAIFIPTDKLIYQIKRVNVTYSEKAKDAAEKRAHKAEEDKMKKGVFKLAASVVRGDTACLYKRLGVNAEASKTDIKRAFRRCAFLKDMK